MLISRIKQEISSNRLLKPLQKLQRRSADTAAGDASWSSVSIVDAAGDNSYPIAVYYFLAIKTRKTRQKVNYWLNSLVGST